MLPPNLPAGSPVHVARAALARIREGAVKEARPDSPVGELVVVTGDTALVRWPNAAVWPVAVADLTPAGTQLAMPEAA